VRRKIFDVAKHLAKLDAPDVRDRPHWLPHANSALGIAELVKEVHPDAKVLIGGLSASYFHREVIDHPAVDFVRVAIPPRSSAASCFTPCARERPSRGSRTWRTDAQSSSGRPTHRTQLAMDLEHPDAWHHDSPEFKPTFRRSSDPFSVIFRAPAAPAGRREGELSAD